MLGSVIPTNPTNTALITGFSTGMSWHWRGWRQRGPRRERGWQSGWGVFLLCVDLVTFSVASVVVVFNDFVSFRSPRMPPPLQQKRPSVMTRSSCRSPLRRLAPPRSPSQRCVWPGIGVGWVVVVCFVLADLNILSPHRKTPRRRNMTRSPSPHQLTSHPSPHQLTSHPSPHQLTSHPRPHQLTSHPRPHQLMPPWSRSRRWVCALLLSFLLICVVCLLSLHLPNYPTCRQTTPKRQTPTKEMHMSRGQQRCVCPFNFCCGGDSLEPWWTFCTFWKLLIWHIWSFGLGTACHCCSLPISFSPWNSPTGRGQQRQRCCFSCDTGKEGVCRSIQLDVVGTHEEHFSQLKHRTACCSLCQLCHCYFIHCSLFRTDCPRRWKTSQMLVPAETGVLGSLKSAWLGNGVKIFWGPESDRQLQARLGWRGTHFTVTPIWRCCRVLRGRPISCPGCVVGTKDHIASLLFRVCGQWTKKVQNYWAKPTLQGGFFGFHKGVNEDRPLRARSSSSTGRERCVRGFSLSWGRIVHFRLKKSNKKIVLNFAGLSGKNCGEPWGKGKTI